MINVDGDYKEIVSWMNENPVRGVRHTNLHGFVLDVGMMNVGLFSLNDDHSGEEHCLVCTGYGSAIYECSFSDLTIEVDMDDGCFNLDVEHPEESHLIRF